MPARPSAWPPPLVQLAASGVWDALDGGTLIVACSGGRDSTALALATRKLLADAAFSSRFRAAPRLLLWHLDHGLRAGSELDAQFVRGLGAQLGVETVVERAELGEQLAAVGGNPEALARAERYTRLLRLAESKQPARALTAHHLDDQAETVLHHIVRGTHLAGLRGIAPVYREMVFRPWIELAGTEIENYLSGCRQGYVTDPTNADLRLTRNRLRREVMPVLAKINPRVREHLGQLAAFAREGFVTRAAEVEPAPTELPTEGLPLLAAIRFTLAEAVPGQWEHFRRNGRPDGPRWECFLPAGVELPLELRAWRVGERMRLAGGGSKTVGDIFTDARVPEALRPLWAVLADASGQALWIPSVADGAAMRIGEGEEPWYVVTLEDMK